MQQVRVTIDDEGRICLPEQLRDILKWKEGTLLDAEVLDSGQLVIHPAEEGWFLAEKEGVLVVRGQSSADVQTDLEILRAARLADLSGMPE